MNKKRYIRKTLQSSQPGEIYYNSRSNIDVIQVIKRYEGFKDEYGYEDPNGDTIEYYDFIGQKNGKINSRSIIAERFQHDLGGTSPAVAESDLNFSDRHAHIISRVFEDYG